MGIFKKKKKWKNYSGNINIYSDLKISDIPKIISEENIHSLQLYEFEKPNKQTWGVLNEFYKKYPEIGLRVHWYDEQDLAFYKYLPNIRNFTIASFNTKDYRPLHSNVELKHFGIEETKSIAVDLSFIREFKNLESLYVDGMKKGLENVKYLEKLKTLSFRGVKMDSLDFLSDLHSLDELQLSFGSYKNLDSLSKLKQLKRLEFSRVRQIPNFDFLNSLAKLKILEFEGMSKMEKLPNMSGLINLKKILIDNNTKLTDITNVNQLPNLETFLLYFPENFKASYRKELIEQAIEFLLNSKTVKYTSLFHWVDDDIKEKLLKKGIEKWRYNDSGSLCRDKTK